MSVNPDELVELQLKIKYTEALVAIRKILEGYKNLDGSARAFAAFVIDSSKQMGISSAQFLSNLKQIDKELSKISASGRGPLGIASGGGIFGSGFQKEVTQNIKYLENELAPAAKKAGEGIKTIKPAAEAATQGLFSLKNMARVALGTLEAMGIFLIVQFVQNAIKKAIDGVRQLELAFYKLQIAERSLSQSGIDVSMEDFKDTIKEIQKLYPFISKLDATKLVSDVALLTKDLHLSREEIERLAKVIPQLALNSPTQITNEQATQQMINALANHGKGLKDLGIIENAQTIRQKAIDTHLVASAEAYDNLTAEARQYIDVLVLIGSAEKSAADGQALMNEYMGTTDESIKEAQSSWEDFLGGLGTLAAPAMIEGLKLLIDQLERMNEWLLKNQKTLTIVIATFAGIIEAQRALNESKGQETWVDKLLGVISPALEEIRRLGKFGTSDFADAFRKGFDDAIKSSEEFGKSIDTATDKTKDLDDALTGLDSDQIEKLDDEMKDFYSDLEKLEEKRKSLEEDFNTKTEREDQDHHVDQIRKEQDYQINRNQVIQDYNHHRADIEQKYRDQEINDEARFQEQLRQLREKYLFNLEDALHERDARQVLRLQRQYQMDREAMVNENALKKQEEQQQKAEELAAAKADLAEKLARMDEEHRIEMERFEEDYRLKKEREAEDHARDMEDLRQQISDRITELTRALTDEFDLNEQAAADLQNLLARYYGPGGTFDQLYSYSYASMVANASQMMAALQAILSGAGALAMSPQSVSTAPWQNGPQNPMNVPAGSHARGGSFLATRSTKAIFGEKGPELATFTPLRNMQGGLLGGLDKSISMGGGNGNGMLKIEMLLSPDLEARIIENTLGQTAEIITRVNRSKN